MSTAKQHLMAKFYTDSSIKMCVKTTINAKFNCESNAIKNESLDGLIIL